MDWKSAEEQPVNGRPNAKIKKQSNRRDHNEYCTQTAVFVNPSYKDNEIYSHLVINPVSEEHTTLGQRYPGENGITIPTAYRMILSMTRRVLHCLTRGSTTSKKCELAVSHRTVLG